MIRTRNLAMKHASVNEFLGASKELKDWSQQWCPGKTYFELFPGTAGSVSPGKQHTWSGASCFAHTEAKLSSSDSGKNMNITLTGTMANASHCSDLYMISTSYRILDFVDLSTDNSQQTFEWTLLNSNETKDVIQSGVHVLVSNLNRVNIYSNHSMSCFSFCYSFFHVVYWAPLNRP